jgi:hypothetical protein
MSTKSREVIYGGQIAGAKIRAEAARKRAVEAARDADRAEADACMVDPHGGLWRPRTALTDHRPMSEWRLRLAAGEMPSLQYRGQHPARRDQAIHRYGSLRLR